MPRRRDKWTTRLRTKAMALLLAALCGVLMAGCGGAQKTYSWKPQAASRRSPPRSTTRPVETTSNMAGADLLEESHRAAKVTWVAVPSPDGKKMRWVQVK